MFSIIITTYNSEKYIEETITNVLYASNNICREIIVVDDGSKDNTRDILKKFNDYEEVKIIHQSNKGVSKARNKGLKYISKMSKLTTFIDDSDKVSDNFFETHIDFFEKNRNINLAISPIVTNKDNKYKNHSLNYCFNEEKDYIDAFENYNCIRFHIGGVVFRTEILKAIEKPFDESIHFGKMLN